MAHFGRFLSGVVLILAVLADGNLLRGGGMEGSFAGGLAAGWVKNCYGSNDVVFAEETHNVHSGKAAQRVTCTKFVTGGVQFHSVNVAVEKGKPYTLRLWMKGDVPSPVYIGIRKHGEPYTGYLKRYVSSEERVAALRAHRQGERQRSAMRPVPHVFRQGNLVGG